MNLLKKHLTIPLIALVAANTIPLFGVLFLGWGAFSVVLLYWSENLVIGFYNVLKMIFVKTPGDANPIGKFFVIPFFMVHYGGFTAGHGLFVLSLFGENMDGAMGTMGGEWPCFLVFLQLLLNVVKQMFLIISPEMKLALLALFISHGVSFVYNYLIKGEFAEIKLDKLMSQPYGRIIVMHIAILAGGFLAVSMGDPMGILVVLVILKIIVDAKLHLRQHKKPRNAP